MKNAVVTFIAILFTTIVTRSKTEELRLPDYIMPCNASDEKCLKDTLEALQPRIASGIPEFQLPSVDSITFPTYSFSRNPRPTTNYTATWTNPRCTGGSNFTVSKFHVDLDQLKLELVIIFPELTVKANESMISGIVFGAGVNEEGPASLNYRNLTVGFTLSGSEVLKDGKRHANWTEDAIDVSSDYIDYNIANLVKRKPVQEYANLIDDNRQEADGEVELVVRNTFVAFIFRIVNAVHDKYPLSVLYK